MARSQRPGGAALLIAAALSVAHIPVAACGAFAESRAREAVRDSALAESPAREAIEDGAFAESSERAAAARDSASILVIAPIEVTAPRPIEDPELRLRPGFARAYDLTGARDRVRVVSEVLSGAVGVHVRQFGGIGSFSTVSVRGSSAGQVAVYLDGVPLNSPEYGIVNLGDFPTQALERIEVYRGGAPITFESPGGGVINLVSRKLDGSWADISVGHGTFATRHADAGGGWRRGNSAALLVGQYLGSRGDFPYLDDNATAFNADDDSVRERANNDLESVALTGRAEQRLGRVTLDLTLDHFSKSQGMPGTGANPALDAQLRSDREIANLRARWSGRGAAGAAESPLAPSARIFGVRQRDRFADRDGELTGLRQDNDDKTTRVGAQIEGGVRLPLAQTLLFVSEARRERYNPSINLPEPRELPESERRVALVGIEDRFAPFGERVDFVANLRRQYTDDEFPGGPPYPGALPVPPTSRAIYHSSWTAGARVNLTNALAVKASVARLPRMPTLEELFGNRAGIYGNPRVVPERVATHDVGVVWSRAPQSRASAFDPTWIDGQISAYRSDATDLIVFIQNSQRSSVAQNISAARLSGIELSVRAEWAGGLAVDLAGTRQWTRDEGDIAYWRGKELPGRPRDEASLRLSMARPSWRASYDLHYLSANALDRYNQNIVPARALHDASLGVMPWSAGAELYGEIRNITDQHAQDFAGYPLPGRTLYVGARFRHLPKETDR
jgi:iron complex outermembrane receptor protein